MFKPILVRFKWLIVSATLLSVLGALAGLGMLKIITDQLSQIGHPQSHFAMRFAIFGAAIISVLVFSFASRYLLAKLGALVVYEFRDSLSKRLLSTPYAAIEKLKGHRIMAVMKTDAAKLSDGLLMMPNFVYSLVTVLLCLAYMIYTSWQLFILVFSLIVVIFLVARFFLKFGLAHYRCLREYEDELFSGLRTLVDGAKELTLNANRRRFVYQRILLPNFVDIRRCSIKVSLIFTMLNGMTSTLIFFVIGVIVFGSRIYFTEIPLADVVSFVLAILYMINPMESVVGSLNQISEFTASYRKIEGLDLADDDNFEENLAVKRSFVETQPWQTLSAENVIYQYEAQEGNNDDYQFHVGPVDVQFQRGEAVFLTGGNGSGKSTFAKLLVGLYQPDQGRIRLDQNEVGESIAVTDYQQLFSTIFSDFYLFEHVLDPKGQLAKDEVIGKYLTDLGLATKVDSKEGKLSSVMLSQGQKKRLALLMSYIEDSPICLYDEWAADQDPTFREIFYTKIIPELKRQNKLVVVITHDDRYFDLADQLIKFENGQIIKNIRPDIGIEETDEVISVSVVPA
ncbi:MAG: ABC transporter ATP-binding/permease protein YojI [Candidatus Celerinatantimonas neptuna]|nr:MAG: ABC transporter ATP-binding/permease protein YojI [Candidatus Celerinatantimonas neptuna]